MASDQQNAAAAAVLTIDRARASSFGITPALIDSTIYDAIGQRQVAQYFTRSTAITWYWRPRCSCRTTHACLVSQMLTLFSTPVVYLYLDRAHHWYVRRKTARTGGKPPSPPGQRPRRDRTPQYMGGEGE